MKKTTSKISWIGLLTAAAMLFFLPMTTYAQEHGHDRDEHHDRHEHHDSDHHDHHDRDHDRRGRDVVVHHHDDYREVVVENRHFFYRGGAFYDRGPNGYVVVTAPIGARITVLPGGYRVIRRHRVRYYLFGGIYYRFVPSEHVYVVVNAPF